MPVLRAKQEITDAMLVFQMCYMTNARRTENHGRRFMEILAVRRLIAVEENALLISAFLGRRRIKDA